MAGRKRIKRAADRSGRAPFWLQERPAHRGPLIEEKAMMIFQPDILIDAQYQASQRRRFHLEPERVLMLAVLQDAVGCFQGHVSARCKRKRTMHSDAEAWISSNDRSYPFSFENICDALGFDPAYMREGLARWKRNAVQITSGEQTAVRVGRAGV